MAPITQDPAHLTNITRRSRSKAYYVYHNSTPGLQQHQDQADTAIFRPSKAPHFSANSFVPYIPPTLHANIVSSTSAMPENHLARLSVKEIAFILVGALVAAMLGGTVFIMMRSIITKKARRFLDCRRQRIKKKKLLAEGKRTTHEELGDPLWGTPLRLVYVEGIDDTKPISTRRSLSPESPSLSPSMLWLPHRQHDSKAAREEDACQIHLEDEEGDITLALAQTLRNTSPNSKDVVYSMASAGKSSFEYSEDLPSPSSSRAWQETDSTSSHETTKPADSFSVSSSHSSVTSLDSSKSGNDDEDFEELKEIEVGYEIRRAHAQSIELKKGILMSCRHSSSASNISVSLPAFVISEAVPSLEPLDEGNFAPLFSLRTSSSSKSSLATAISWSSIMRESSHGTMHSLSNSFSTIHIEGWDVDDSERQLQLPVPLLILTRPSDSSIYTSASESSSNVSIDLCDFPLPPIPSKAPSYYSKLCNTIQGVPRPF